MRNKWTETVGEMTLTLKCMRQTLSERAAFINLLLEDIVKLRQRIVDIQADRDKLEELVGLLTTKIKKGE